jgi:uncharacterized protein YnzC (UPF0291/DUF896 family)
MLVIIAGQLYNRDMNPIVESNAFERAVAPALKQAFPLVSSSNVFELAADNNLVSRIEELAAKSTDGELSEQEKAEYHGYVRANKFIATLRRQLRRIVNTTA